MGCTDSKESRPHGARPAPRHNDQQPLMTDNANDDDGLETPRAAGGNNHARPAPPQQQQQQYPPVHGDHGQPGGERRALNQREAAEQEEVRQMAAMLQYEKSQGPGPQHQQYPPPQQPYYAPPPPPQQRQPPPPQAARMETASIAQLQEMYPGLQRDVIAAVLESHHGNQELVHKELAELSTTVNTASPPREPASASGSSHPPAAAGSEHTPPAPSAPPRNMSLSGGYATGDAVDAFFQDQYYPGRVVGQEANGDYTIEWDEDGSKTAVPPGLVRPRR